MELVPFSTYVTLVVFIAVFKFFTCGLRQIHYSVLFQDVLVEGADQVHILSSGIRCATECQTSSICLSFAYSDNEKKCYFYNRVSLRQDSRTSHPGIITYVPLIENVALNKHTAAGATINSWATPDRVVNGNFLDKHQSYSKGRQWWCVDLGMTYDLQTVVVYNRLGLYSNRFRNFEMRLSKSPGCNTGNMDSTPNCYKNDGSTKNIYSVSSCNQPSSGFDGIRAVFFIVYNTNLHVREIEVYAM